jgi:hypothetical protein
MLKFDVNHLIYATNDLYTASADELAIVMHTLQMLEIHPQYQTLTLTMEPVTQKGSSTSAKRAMNCVCLGVSEPSPVLRCSTDVVLVMCVREVGSYVSSGLRF